MDLRLSRRAWLFASVAVTVAVALTAALATAQDDATALSCAAFDSQADAQAQFAELGGTPARAVGGLDDDRDGIACEGLPAPYGAYATLGYNRSGGFLYGTASMPAAGAGAERYPCLRGDRKGPLGPRRLRIYRVLPGGERPILTGVGAEARPESGRLLWKAPRATLAPGLYYVAFQEKIRTTPYGPNECPGFSSRLLQLPRPGQMTS